MREPPGMTRPKRNALTRPSPFSPVLGGSSKVTCNFVVYRAKNGKVDTYYGHNLYTLDWSGEAWKIASKRVVLDMDMLYPGKISIVL